MEEYKKIQAHVQLEIKNALRKYAEENQFDLSKIPTHAHTGMDVQQIDPRNLLGFVIETSADAAVAPTDKPQNGTIRFLVDNKAETAHWYFWAFLPDVKTGVQAWHYVALT